MDTINEITENGVEAVQEQVETNMVEMATQQVEVVAEQVEVATQQVEAASQQVETVVEQVEVAATQQVEAVAEQVEVATQQAEEVAAEQVPIVKQLVIDTSDDMLIAGQKALDTTIVHAAEKVADVEQVIVKSLEDDNTLTPLQNEVLTIVMNDVQHLVQHIMVDMDVANQIKIMQMVSCIIKSLEDAALVKYALVGADKKAIALACGRKCIKMFVKEHLDILMLYDTIAEPALETMISLSRSLSKVKPIIDEQSTNCCAALFSCISGSK
jgi:hypothetical protein